MRNHKPNFNPHMGAKKLAVKNFRTQAKADPQLYLNQVWEKLDAALTVVFKNEKITFSLEELYRGVENLCRQGHAQEVCLRLQKKSEVYVSEDLKQPLLERLSSKNVDVLRAVLAAWGTWNDQLVSFHNIIWYHKIRGKTDNLFARKSSTGYSAIWIDHIYFNNHAPYKI